jgi:hypothetical protein
MSGQDNAKIQKDLLSKLAKNDVTVDKAAAEKMKEEIMTANTAKRWLGIGVHEVFIQTVELTQAKTGTMGMKFNLENEEGQGEVTMWLSEGALPYTIKNVSALVVHASKDDKKDAARTFMSNVVSAKGLFDVAKEKLIQAQCWLSVREAKNGSTYTNKDGEEKPSLERNLLSYAPKETQVQAVVKATGGEVTRDEDILSKLPF